MLLRVGQVCEGGWLAFSYVLTWQEHFGYLTKEQLDKPCKAQQYMLMPVQKKYDKKIAEQKNKLCSLSRLVYFKNITNTM